LAKVEDVSYYWSRTAPAYRQAILAGVLTMIGNRDAVSTNPQ
jgi:hypothetical protein